MQFMPRHLSISTTRRGVLLIDTLVAVVIMGVALAVLIGIASSALRAQQQGERLQIVAMLLDEKLSMVVAVGPDTFAREFDESGVCDAPFQDYRYSIDVSSTTDGDPYSVVATILWTESGRERSESMEALIAPRLGDDPDPDRRPQESVERSSENAP